MIPPPPEGSRLVPVDFDPFAEPGPAGRALPLTEAQREIWAAVQMGDDASCAYNQCYALRLVGSVSLDALRAATQQLFDRHEALRMRFDGSGDSQTVAAPATVEIPVVDLSGLAPFERERRLEEVFADAVETPFDLVAGPVARAQVVVETSDRYLLVFTAHHIVFDGASGRVFFAELAAAYTAHCRGEVPQLRPAARFSDFVEQETGPVGAARAGQALSYWRARFADGAPTLDLPLDRPRAPVKTYRGARQTLTLNAALTAGLKRVAADQGCTLVGLMLAALQALLHRLTGQSRVVVGVAADMRAASGSDGVVGHATNFLPILAEVEGGRPFSAHLRCARSLLLDASDHSALTFGSLVRDLGLPRDPSRTPLVSCLFNLGRSAPALGLGGIVSELFMPPRRYENFELELQVQDTGPELAIDCSHNLDLFDPETVRRWLGHYETLLAGVVERVDSRLAMLPLLTPAQQEQQCAWNATEAPLPGVGVANLVSAQARRTPGLVALEFNGRTLTYAELEIWTERLAQRLRARGVRPGVRVGVFMERSPEMVAGLLGVLRAGGAYVPLDPSFPTDRLAYMVADAKVALLLTHAEVVGRTPSTAIPVLLVEEEEAAGAEGGTADAATAAPDDLAYVIYTSGSTGRPKGVAVTHRSLVNLLESMGREPGLTEHDILLSVTTLSFDIAALELYLPLIKGARVVLASREEALDPQLLLARMGASGATVMQATPATWRMLLESGWQRTPRLKALCGGEALAGDLAQELLDHAGDVWNLYGPTETTVWSSVWHVGPGSVSIGRPIANTQLWVLNADLERQPVGVAGELCIGGAGVARGYWERPELTAERFVPDPFSGRPGARLYRTGDLARWLSDGRLECLGRIDNQVKVRGFRIELGEIETALRECVGVEQVAVVPVGAPDERRLTAFVVARRGAARDPAPLRAVLGQRLPAYMLPSSFVFLEALPLTPNGKVDRKALADVDAGTAPSAAEHVAPRTPTEETVASAWAAILEVKAPGVHDNFFEVGGHSLSAARLTARLRERFGISVGLRSLFERPTIAGLSEIIDVSLLARDARKPEGEDPEREELEFT